MKNRFYNSPLTRLQRLVLLLSTTVLPASAQEAASKPGTLIVKDMLGDE